MIIDGKKLAEEIKVSLKKEVVAIDKQLRLAAIWVGDDVVTEKFLERKKTFGQDIGVDVRIYKLPKDISTTELRKKVSEIVHIEQNTAIVVQLPLPGHINAQYILDGIIPAKDADMLSSKSVGLFTVGRSTILPPVVGAVKYILEKNDIDVRGKWVVVVGAGRLVGKPVSTWFLNNGATVIVCDEHTSDIGSFTRKADIIVTGVGKPNLITADMVRDGVIVIDAGTSESVGRLVGDVDEAVAQKASLSTPVPGGVGPLTVAMLFANVVTLAKKS